MMREISFKFITVRNGADCSKLYPSSGSSPTIRMNTTGEIKMSLSGSFVDPEGAVDWLSDQIRVELVIDGVSSPVGVFLPASVRYVEDSASKSVNVEAFDRCWILKDTVVDGLYFIPSGTNYVTAINTLLASASIALISATPTTAVLAEDREDWEMGTSYLTIINQLLSEINYKPLWFNHDGVAIIEPKSTPSAENIQHTLDDTNVQSLMLPEINRSMDIYKAPNVFVCVCSNPDKETVMIARSENVNPESPLSISRRGRRIVQLTNVDNIASQAELQEYADQLRDKSMISAETINVTTALLPSYGVEDITAIRYKDFSAVCVEKAWAMSLQVGGNMTHTLERVVINIG